MCIKSNSGNIKMIPSDNNPDNEFFAPQKKNNGILFSKSVVVD